MFFLEKKKSFIRFQTITICPIFIKNLSMQSFFKLITLSALCFLSFSCRSQVVATEVTDSIRTDTTFVNLKEYSADFVYDMKYATSDNFLNAKVYDCAECFLRLKTVKALLQANKEFISQGLRIKLFDCYRPLDIQKKMWEIVSNPKYVADPAKGSIHNRGGAIDITLVDNNGKELDMGTKFDFFGIEASHAYSKLPQKVKDNRKLLKKIMIANQFNSFDSEWWHYNLKAGLTDAVSNEKWECN
jgi:D-alanyl-D-alanine dipeptidase